MQKKLKNSYRMELPSQILRSILILFFDTKVKSANWLIKSLVSLAQRPEIIQNGFRKADILDVLSVNAKQ